MNSLEQDEGKKMGWFEKLLISTASADEATLRISPAHDLQHVKATAWLLIFVMAYQAALFSLVAHRLFASPGQIRPELMLVAIFLALFIMKIDAYTVVSSQWHLSGIEEIRRGGIDISGGKTARIKAGIYLVFRILLSLGLAQLTAIFASLIIFGGDIDARIQDNYLRANAHLVADATALVDSEIQRASEDVKAESSRVAALAAQVTAVRQNEIDPSSGDPQVQQAQQEMTLLLTQRAKAEDEARAAESLSSAELGGIKSAATSGQAGNGPRRKAALEQAANAKAHVETIGKELDASRTRLDDLRKKLATANEATKKLSHDQLPAFEAALAEENTKLSSLKDQLTSLTQGREDAIRRATENAPDHVKLDNGFLAQIVALEMIAQADNKIAAVILLIDVTSFGLELAAVLSKVTTFCPTTYAALIARDSFLRAVHIADEISRDLDISARRFDNEAQILAREESPANDNEPGAGSVFGPGPQDGSGGLTPQPKRPRGRPRKPLN